jgi:phosphohistidine phosphatase
MKEVYLIRHAKSSWDDSSLADHDRPLNKRGRRDAPKMATYLKDSIGSVDVIVSSSAKRAQLTAKEFELAFEDSLEEFVTERDLYHASREEILRVISQIDDRYDKALVFGHNPGFTTFANLFSSIYIDNVPTTGIVGFKFAVNNWNEVSESNGNIFLFTYPKKLY